MSRAYRIRISESAHRTIKVGDGFSFKLEVLEVVDRCMTESLVESELTDAGFEKSEDGIWVRDDGDGVVTSVDVKESTVTVSSHEQTDIHIDREREIQVYAENDEEMRRRSKADLKASVDGEAKKCESELQSKITKNIEGKLCDIQDEFGKISNRVTSAALKAKAASMGEIKEISENQETGELTIRIKL